MAAATRIKKRERPTGGREPGKLTEILQLDPIILVDATGKIQSASESVRRVFGWEPAGLLGKDFRSIFHDSHALLLDRLLGRGGKARRAATLARPQDLDGLRKGGTVFPIDLTVSATDFPGQPVPVFVILIRAKQESTAGPTGDEAERSRLLAVVAEQSKAIAAAQSRLIQSDRMAAMGTLAAGLGHDMNNVLLPMRAHLNAIAAKYCQPEGREHLIAVQRSLGYLQQLSDGLHHLTLDPEADVGQTVTNLNRWWKDAGRLLCNVLPADVRVAVELDSQLPEVFIEPHRLTQVVLNLFVNSGEALSGRIAGNRGSAAEKLVRIWAKVDPTLKVLQLGVTDNGPGMGPEITRRAFELFFTTKTRRLGSGLGMPLVQRLVSGVGGSVKVESRCRQTGKGAGERGKSGTTVVLSLRISVEKRRAGIDFVTPKLANRRVAVVSVADGRVAAMVKLVLGTAVNPETAGGPEVNRPRFEVISASEPGDADVWITDSSALALETAERWCAGDSTRRVLLAGVPDNRSAVKWRRLGAVVIEDVEQYQEIRLGLLRALAV